MAHSTPEGRLTNSQIVSLGANISVRNMKAIATSYMGLSKEVVRNIADKHRDDQEGITRELIEKWKNKPQNSDRNQVKALAHLLFKAADEHGHVDPEKIQKILQLSRHELTASLSDASITENKELKELADILRPITKERTNIDMIPGGNTHTVKLEDLYTELAIDNVESRPMGVHITPVLDYRELFSKISVRFGPKGVKGKRVLGKGDPGSGKTTFAKKVAWDWARELFTAFSVVFFVALKLVQPGDLIENIIMQQTPELEVLKVTSQKLRSILEKFGSHCLLILDGYDELVSGNRRNEDITKILKGQTFLSCNVLLTSRPHSISEIKQHFSTIVSIQGFTEKHAREFASRILIDKDKIDPIMEIQCLNANEYFKEGNSVYMCPLLLLFLCVLVNGEEFDLKRKEVTLGEIYTRLVRSLYRKYTVRKGIAFEQSEFVEVLKKLGKLALESLHPRGGFMQKSKILEQVGEDAFDYGLLIGNEVFSLLETTNTRISFPDRKIQKYLAAFYFIMTLNCEESTENLQGVNPIFMKIPAFLHFCLWFVGKYCTREYFLLENKNEVYRYLEAYVINRIDATNFSSTEVFTRYPALNMCGAQRDELIIQFFKKVLSRCKKIRELELNSKEHIDTMMDVVRPLLPQLSLIQLSTQMQLYSRLVPDRLCSEELHIVINHVSKRHADELLASCKGLDKSLSVYFLLGETKDLCKYLTADISALYIKANDPSARRCLWGIQNIPYSPHLTRLYLSGQELDDNLALALSKAVEAGNLPDVRLLCFEQCEMKGKLHLLFRSQWPTLTHLDLCECFLDESDIGVLSKINVLLPNLTSLGIFLGDKRTDYLMSLTEISRHLGSDKVRLRFPRHIALFDLFESQMPNITELWMDSMNKHEYKKLIAALNKGALAQLGELGISMWKYVNENKMVDFVIHGLEEDGVQCDIIKQDNIIEWLPPVNVPTLSQLTLHGFICTMYHLDMVTQSTVLTKLRKLDISHSSGMTETLSILLCHKFPSLNSLILSDCGLNSQDLCSLAQARAKGRLPELRHLDISRNDSLKGKLECLFSCQAQWESLSSLNAIHDSKDDVFLERYHFCILKVEPSNKLMISEKSINFLFQPGNRCWKKIQKVYIATDSKYQNKIPSEILDALERGLLPALNYVFVICHENLKMESIEAGRKRLGMSSVVSLAEDKRLTESQTIELAAAVREYLTALMTHLVNDGVDNAAVRVKLAKYGVEYYSESEYEKSVDGSSL